VALWQRGALLFGKIVTVTGQRVPKSILQENYELHCDTALAVFFTVQYCLDQKTRQSPSMHACPSWQVSVETKLTDQSAHAEDCMQFQQELGRACGVGKFAYSCTGTHLVNAPTVYGRPT
jgi:hypothetical protein